MTTFTEADIPAGLRLTRKHWHEAGGQRYVCFGQATDPEVVAAAIAAAFPEYRAEQTILGAGHQARIENFARCTPSFRAIAMKTGCPSCGSFNKSFRPTQCADCRAVGAEVA